MYEQNENWLFCDYTVEEINLREEKEKTVSCLFLFATAELLL